MLSRCCEASAFTLTNREQLQISQIIEFPKYLWYNSVVAPTLGPCCRLRESQPQVAPRSLSGGCPSDRSKPPKCLIHIFDLNQERLHQWHRPERSTGSTH